MTKLMTKSMTKPLLYSKICHFWALNFDREALTITFYSSRTIKNGGCDRCFDPRNFRYSFYRRWIDRFRWVRFFLNIFVSKGDQISEGIFIFIPSPNRMHEINFHQRFPFRLKVDGQWFHVFFEDGTKVKIPSEI